MQRYFVDKKENNKLIINQEDHNHIKNVMRMTSGDKVEIVHNNIGYLASLNITKDEIFGNIIEELETSSPSYSLTVALSLIKKDKFDWAIQKMVELGVDKVVPLNTNRVVVDYSGKEDKKIERWSKIAKESAEQSKRFTIPEITNITKLDDLETADTIKLVASVNKNASTINSVLNKCSNNDKIIVVIGPEGGLTDEEVTNLLNKGFKEVSFGNNIMRAETAAIYAAGIVKYNYMEE